MLLLTCIVTLICYGYYGLLMWLPNMLAVMEMNTSKGLCGRIAVINHPKVVHHTDTCHPHRKVYVESMLIAASSLPGNIASTLLIDKIGRKLLLIPCLFICAISVILMMLIKSHVAALLFSCLFSALSVIPFNVLNCIGIELFPTRFRAYSFSTQYMFGRVGAILATVSFGYFLDIYCYLPLLIVAINLMIAGAMSCGLKETKGLQIL
ncbi:hypothetical protein GJ496_000075 [Pomphorhynchus laevis]|nr:hypothetical protein GJ496_000075 [Pomphorhynchus laevis]